MYLISQVEIEGFWGKYKVDVRVNPDINIFIGKNGTGKTTFINMLSAVLKVDLKSLLILDFKKISIFLKSYDDATNADPDMISVIKTITVVKSLIDDKPDQLISYTLDDSKDKKYDIVLNLRDIDMLMRNSRRRALIGASFQELEKRISLLINISSLTVHRITFDYSEEDYNYTNRNGFVVPHIDQRLNELMVRLKSYQLNLAKKNDEISSNLQKEVLKSILYNRDFDLFSMDNLNSVLTTEKEELITAYRELGVYDDNIGKKINSHTKVINKSIAKLQKIRLDDSLPLTANDVMPISLLKRTQHIIRQSLKAKEDKHQISELIDLYIEIIKKFICDKQISISQNGDLQINIETKEILLSDLSSGEKQLLIILTEALLQENTPYIFLADEPELSLHIEWQRKIIPSILMLNPSAQVIVATHSPEIAGSGKGKIIDMEDIRNV